MKDINANSAPEARRKVAIYIRVSTSFQADKDSLPMQRKDLIAYSELILNIPDYEIFEDAGYSGKNTDRPAYQNMMSRIKEGEFSHLLVWKIDRITRNLIDFSEMYSELKKLRVVFVSKNEQFDTSTAMGEAMLKIILVFAELERKMTAERVTATMISRASQGIWNGGRIPYGYDYDRETKEISINESEAEICMIIAEDYLKYKSLIHTARMLNSKGYTSRAGTEWSPSTVRSIIQNPFYCGVYRYNRFHGSEKRTANDKSEWVIVTDHHPAIFSEDIQKAMIRISDINRTFQNTENQNNRRKYIHVFGQICFCGKCGSKMFSIPGRTHKDGFMTTNHVCRMRKNTNSCNNPALTDLVIGEFVINYISNILNAKKNFSKLKAPQELQERLLQGKIFKDVKIIEPSGLNALFDLLARYRSDKSFSLIRKPKRKISAADPQIAILIKERDKQERALNRLQDVYLYSEKSIPEKEYILTREDILTKIEDVNKKLSLLHAVNADSLSDEDFIKKASHLLINSKLQNKEYINYKNLAASTETEILHEYIHSMIDQIYIADSKVISITFNNGITNEFTYKKADS